MSTIPTAIAPIAARIGLAHITSPSRPSAKPRFNTLAIRLPFIATATSSAAFFQPPDKCCNFGRNQFTVFADPIRQTVDQRLQDRQQFLTQRVLDALRRDA